MEIFPQKQEKRWKVMDERFWQFQIYPENEVEPEKKKKRSYILDLIPKDGYLAKYRKKEKEKNENYRR